MSTWLDERVSTTRHEFTVIEQVWRADNQGFYRGQLEPPMVLPSGRTIDEAVLFARGPDFIEKTPESFDLNHHRLRQWTPAYLTSPVSGLGKPGKRETVEVAAAATESALP